MISVSDVNDKKPVFPDGPYLREVRENEEPGEAVGFVLAKDQDDKENAIITYTLLRHTDRFLIEPNTGLIRTKVKLDRESNDNRFIVKVRATDSGRRPLYGETEVTIDVTDANDQYPYFEKDETKATVLECGEIGDTVATVVARDNDLGKNAKLLYSIASGNSPRFFRLNNNNGHITIATRLDYENEATRRFHLYISVRDRGFPELISKKNASVIIDVLDCNDNMPRFSQSTYKTSIDEDAPVGQEIIRVRATDKDQGRNGEFDFFIIDPDENYQFTIRKSVLEPGVGIVSLAWRLDRETSSSHTIRIGARDRGSPSLMGDAKISIIVNDVNDNPPQFRPPDFCGSVDEEVTGSQLVTTVHITDPDDPVKNQCPCTYELDDPSGLFEIEFNNLDSYKAFIKTKPSARFDRERLGKQLFKLQVKATDQGGLDSTTDVYVEVGDRNDNEATSGGKMTFDVTSYNGKLKNAVIGRALIIDNDRGLNHTYRQHRLEPKSDVFTIDEYGVVRVTDKGVREGSYTFKVISRPNDSKKPVIISSVTINVKDIPEEMVQNGFPMRIRGLRKPLTCKEIKHVDFASMLANVLEVDMSQVVVFSVQEARSVYRGVDIWFSILKKVGAAGYDEVEFMPYMEVLTKLNPKRKKIERYTGELSFILLFFNIEGFTYRYYKTASHYVIVLCDLIKHFPKLWINSIWGKQRK